MYYYQHNIGDFDKATRHLTRIERSVYRDLIELYYDTEHQLNADTGYLCRKILARSNEEVTAVEQVLNEFFTKTPDGWYHDRCEEEIEKYHSNISQRSEAGKKSAAARKQKRQRALNGSKSSVERDSNDAPTNQEPENNNQEPENNNQEPENNNQEPENNKHKTDIKKISQQADEPAEIFDYWCSVMKKTGAAKFTAERKKLIIARIKEGYTIDHIKQAIDGCSRSDYHMARDGKNRTVYDDLTLICRSGSNIEKFALNIKASSSAAENIVDGYLEFMNEQS